MEREGSSGDEVDADDGRGETEESEWRFDEAAFESDAERDERDEERARAGERDPDGESRGSVAGGTDRGMPVEPESIDLENALFVVLGVVVTLLVFAQFFAG